MSNQIQTFPDKTYADFLNILNHLKCTPDFHLNPKYSRTSSFKPRKRKSLLDSTPPEILSHYLKLNHNCPAGVPKYIPTNLHSDTGYNPTQQEIERAIYDTTQLEIELLSKKVELAQSQPENQDYQQAIISLQAIQLSRLVFTEKFFFNLAFQYSLERGIIVNQEEKPKYLEEQHNFYIIKVFHSSDRKFSLQLTTYEGVEPSRLLLFRIQYNALDHWYSTCHDIVEMVTRNSPMKIIKVHIIPHRFDITDSREMYILAERLSDTVPAKYDPETNISCVIINDITKYGLKQKKIQSYS